MQGPAVCGLPHFPLLKQLCWLFLLATGASCTSPAVCWSALPPDPCVCHGAAVPCTDGGGGGGIRTGSVTVSARNKELQEGCKTCRINASLAAGTGRYLWNPSLEDGGVASVAVPLHTEMQLPGGRPLASKPSVTATAASRSPRPRSQQLCFIFASVNHCSSGFMLVS